MASLLLNPLMLSFYLPWSLLSLLFAIKIDLLQLLVDFDLNMDMHMNPILLLLLDIIHGLKLEAA
jgi:hypothetical protein